MEPWPTVSRRRPRDRRGVARGAGVAPRLGGGEEAGGALQELLAAGEMREDCWRWPGNGCGRGRAEAERSFSLSGRGRAVT